MRTIKRYNLSFTQPTVMGGSDSDAIMEKSESGEWVKLEDIREAIKASIKSFKAECAVINEDYDTPSEENAGRVMYNISMLEWNFESLLKDPV